MVLCSIREADSRKLFSIPLLCNSLFLLNSRSESAPLSKPDWLIAPLLEFKLLRLWGSVPHMVPVLDQAFCSLGVTLGRSAEPGVGCLNFSSSPLFCNNMGNGNKHLCSSIFVYGVAVRCLFMYNIKCLMETFFSSDWNPKLSPCITSLLSSSLICIITICNNEINIIRMNNRE